LACPENLKHEAPRVPEYFELAASVNSSSTIIPADVTVLDPSLSFSPLAGHHCCTAYPADTDGLVLSPRTVESDDKLS